MREISIERPELRPARTTRRRSWGGLLRIPLSTRSQDCLSISTSKPVGYVPADILREIADLLIPADILSFSLTVSLIIAYTSIPFPYLLYFQSSGLRQLLLPVLYETVVLKSSRKCRITLKMLEKRPDICKHIRKFAVRPNYYLAWPKPDEPLQEDWVAHKIEQIAENLTMLDTFDWDGLEVPRDSLWGTLRNAYAGTIIHYQSFLNDADLSCPELRSIFCNVGDRPIDPNSQVLFFLLILSVC
jgi:hypothetical protein